MNWFGIRGNFYFLNLTHLNKFQLMHQLLKRPSLSVTAPLRSAKESDKKSPKNSHSIRFVDWREGTSSAYMLLEMQSKPWQKNDSNRANDLKTETRDIVSAFLTHCTAPNCRVDIHNFGFPVVFGFTKIVRFPENT